MCVANCAPQLVINFHLLPFEQQSYIKLTIFYLHFSISPGGLLQGKDEPRLKIRAYWCSQMTVMQNIWGGSYLHQHF